MGYSKLNVFRSKRHAVLALFGLNLVLVTEVLAETPLERGAYLVRGIAACGNCHTPKGPEGDLPGMELAGMTYTDSEGKVIYQLPNITPDRNTGLGKWDQDDLDYFLESGALPDGDYTGSLMAEVVDNTTSRLTPGDRRAMVDYLRSLEAIPGP